MNAKKKTLSSIKNHSVEFQYHGKTHVVDIELEMSMKSLSVEEIKNTLNRLPGKIAYWSNFKIQMEIELDAVKSDYDDWMAEKYMIVDQDNSKKTEAWKKMKIKSDYAAEYSVWNNQLSELHNAISRVGVIVTGYNNQIWVYREISRLTVAEMAALE